MPSAHLVHSTSARLLSEVHPRRHNFHLREPYSNHVKHARQRNVLATRMRMSAARVEWQEVSTGDAQKPLPPRSGHCLSTLPQDGAGDALIFGGYTEDNNKQRQATNDSWLFSLKDNSWTEYMTASSTSPRARIAAQAVRVGSHVWLIGGWDPGNKGDGGEILNDVWRLDLNASQWSNVILQSKEGASLQTISRFQAVAVGDVIYIHTHRSLQDILAIDVSNPDEPQLSLVPVSSATGSPPAARGLHSCTSINNKLYLFGGASQQGKMMNDLWALDLSSKEWTELHPEGEVPHIRCSHTAVAMGTLIVIFGGSYYREDGSGLQPLDDVVVYDTRHNTWEKPAVSGSKPRARNAAVACMVSETEMLLHGGWNPFKETYDDTFILKLHSQQ